MTTDNSKIVLGDSSATGSAPLSDIFTNFRPFVVATLAFLFIMQIGVCVLLFPDALRGRPDFRAFYTAGYMVRSGHAHQLFDYDLSGQYQNEIVSRMDITLPFYHLPYEALLFVPFSMLGYRAAYITFFLTNLGILSVCFVMARPYLIELRKIWRWLPVALFVCFAPITIALIQGQDSIILLALATGAFVSFQKGRDFLAGMLVGLALFKFQFALPIFVLFVLWGWRRALSGFVLAATFLTAISIWVVGISSTAFYPSYLITLSTAMKTNAEHQRYGIYPDAMPNIRGLFYSVATQHTPHVIVQVVTIVSSLLLVYFVSRSRPSFSIAILASLLVSYHGNIHDAALLIIPMSYLGTLSLEGRSPLHLWTAVTVTTMFTLPTLLLIQAPGYYSLLAIPALVLLVLSAKLPVKINGIAIDSADLRSLKYLVSQ